VKRPNHFISFLLLGMFWAVSPSVYKHLADVSMPVSHTVVISGLSVGIIMLCIVLARSGLHSIDKRVVAYGFGCATLMNIPFGLQLVMAAHVPATELSIVITLSPFFAFLVSSAMKHERPSGRRLGAISLGFLSTLVLILSRQGTLSGRISWPLVISLLIPLLYSVYNTFAARAWPKGADTIQAGAFESLWSGLIALPFLLWYAPFSSPATPVLYDYWVLAAVSLMWVVERLVYFSLITEKGAVYTVQATYVSTPAAVILAAVFFGGATDYWLWISLALLMAALYLNNSGRAAQPQPA
jgi:drug/metabolite transporter (DMT)-like permease